MMGRAQRCVLGLLVLVCAMACTLDDGQPWTTFKASVEVKWDATDRLQEDGRFLTSKNYLIDFEALQLVFRELVVTTSNDATISFDPADPPPGYTLCHQGHCHNEANQLIPYEAIEAELNGGQAVTAVVQAVESPIVVETSVGQGTQSLTLGACSDALGLCEVGPANVTRVGLYLERVVIRATIEDVDADDSSLLALDVDMVVERQLDKQALFELNADGPAVLSLDVKATVLPTLWDQFDFSELQGSGDGISSEAFQTVFEDTLSKHFPVAVL